VLSESSLTSEWCQRELALFLQAAEQTGGATGRIFLVRLDALDHNRWPAAFHGLLGQKFFEQANVDAPRVPWARPRPMIRKSTCTFSGWMT